MTEKPSKKVYKLKPRQYRGCASCGAPLTSDASLKCSPCQIKEAPAQSPEQGPPAKPQGAVPESEPVTLDLMKDLLAEIERQNTADDQIAQEVKQKFSVRDPASANWAAGKIAMWQNEIQRRKAQAREYIAEAERNVARLKFLFLAQLEAWARENIPQDKRSLKLPSATLKFSDTQEKIEVVDDEKVVAWATINLPDAISMSTSLQMLKDHWLGSDKKSLPEGCQVVPKQTNFNVE